MVVLRARAQDVEVRVESLKNVRWNLDTQRDRVWGLPEQVGVDVDRLRDRCSQGEQSDGAVHDRLNEHLDWIRTLYDRVGRLEAQETRRVAARAPARAPAQVPSEELIRMIASAFHQ
ncbi:hypothetical protein PR003_g25702 [Phytophthora rubi]|uniref:Uncharacterized protein n=1 Tax=Phytophthora rubi TaxID=129364 RepID=A0A6A4CM11_9STRA|nr:hypothetical protein PR003_g25702 [Phytophthora rubi]